MLTQFQPVVPPAPKVHDKDLPGWWALFKFNRNTLSTQPRRAFEDPVIRRRILGLEIHPGQRAGRRAACAGDGDGQIQAPGGRRPHPRSARRHRPVPRCRFAMATTAPHACTALHAGQCQPVPSSLHGRGIGTCRPDRRCAERQSVRQSIPGLSRGDTRGCPAGVVLAAGQRRARAHHGDGQVLSRGTRPSQSLRCVCAHHRVIRVCPAQSPPVSRTPGPPPSTRLFRLDGSDGERRPIFLTFCSPHAIPKPGRHCPRRRCATNARR